MDLTNLWQEHRAFITLVVAGLLVFFVGQAVISGVYGIDDMRTQVRNLDASLRRAKAPTTGQLQDVRSENERLRALYEETVNKVGFVPNPKYLLSGKEKPDLQYDRLFNEARNTLVEGAKTLNINVAGNLGMPELSPTRRNEIQRALTALDIITRVVFLAIESQVKVIESVKMVPDTGRRKKSFFKEHRVSFKMQGSAGAMAEFLQRFTLQENFLALDEALFQTVDKDGAVVRADFTVSALTIIVEEPET